MQLKLNQSFISIQSALLKLVLHNEKKRSSNSCKRSKKGYVLFNSTHHISFSERAIVVLIAGDATCKFRVLLLWIEIRLPRTTLSYFCHYLQFSILLSLWHSPIRYFLYPMSNCEICSADSALTNADLILSFYLLMIMITGLTNSDPPFSF